MNYFKEKYNQVSLPKARDDRPGYGLRNSQIGAIHSIASHFTLQSEPAIVTMPTGSGKTAVLMTAPFILEAERVLIITPSKMLRGQVKKEFETLRILKQIGVLPDAIPTPRIKEISSKVNSNEKWAELREYDVCISTPNCISPSYDEIPRPPADLFDLILIDEAHHSPAKTWEGIINSFPTKKRILFTATPFRRDKREIKGKFIYAYPLSKAYQDGIFGRIEFVSVRDKEDPDLNDIELAKRAQAVYEEDKSKGYKHFLMIRTDKKARADHLYKEVYAKHTNLKLEVIHSGHSFTKLTEALEKLDREELDGLISVDMLGEGFDFPNLKIAVIHTPHKSLEVTLQFIGRFARTSTDNLGTAKFLAIPNEIEIEGEKLFQDDAIWSELIINISRIKTQSETRVREFLQRFEIPDISEAEAEDLSLYSLTPRRHVKIYDTSEVELNNEITLANPTEIVYRNTTEEDSTLVLITREIGKPKWARSDNFVEAKYELIIVFYDNDKNLLFINSSRSIDNLYKRISESISSNPRPLPTSYVNRVLNDLKNPKFFNIGMRNRVAASSRESYRIIAGPNSGNSVTTSDGHLYRQGHAYATAQKDGNKITIGFSSSSKVWGSLSSQIPTLIDWCKELGEKIRNTDELVTNSGFDNLEDGEIIERLPQGIIIADWDSKSYDFENPVEVKYHNSSGTEITEHISELELVIDNSLSNDECIVFYICGKGIELKFSFKIPTFEPIGCRGNEILVITDGMEVPITEYINDDAPIVFYTADFSQLRLNELFSYKEGGLKYNSENIEVVDWSNVDIENEVGPSTREKLSIQDFVQQKMKDDNSYKIIYFDHGTGEAADFIGIKKTEDQIVVQLYHCKKSGAAQPGSRVGDVYEVCGQAVKSLKWIENTFMLYQKIKTRKSDDRFVLGDFDTFKRIIVDESKVTKTMFEIVIVQPGLKRSALNDNVLKSLAATSDYVSIAGHTLRVISSE